MNYLPQYNKNFTEFTLRQLILVLGCGLLYAVCLIYFSSDAIKIEFLPVTGLAIAAILRNRKFDLIGIFTGVWLAQYFFGHQLPLHAFLAIVAGALEAVFGAMLLTSYKKFDVELSNPQGFLYLLLVSLVTPVVSTSFLGLTLSSHQNAAGLSFLATSYQYWLGDSLGIVLWLSLILVWRKPPFFWGKRQRGIEFFALLLLSFLVGQIIFCGWFGSIFGDISRGYWMFLVVLLGAIRLGRHGVIIILIMATVQALSGAMIGKGAFATDLQNTHLFNLWIYTATLTTVGMTLAIVLKGRLISEGNFRSLFENSPMAMMAIDSATGKILQVNAVGVALWGYSREELTEKNIVDITHPEDVLVTQVVLQSHFRDELEDNQPFQKRYVRKDGQSFWSEVTVSKVRDETGAPLYNLASVIDITERKKIEEELLHLSMAVEQSPESIVITDTEGIIEYVNEAYLKKSGFSREELLGQDSRVVQSGNTPRATYDSLWDTLRRGEVWEGEFINRTKSGIEYTEHAIISPIRRPDGCITHYVAVKEDITEKIRSKKQLYRLAYFDEITDLPNYVMLQEHINQQILKATQYSAHSALITLNLDRFKTVNDANGQAMANLLLKEIGARLVQNLHSVDVVSRTSGDEFCILLPDVDKDLTTAAHLVMQISQKLHACMRAPFNVGGDEVIMTACHGIALFTGTDVESPFDVIRRANTALHHAKSQGCEQSVFFERSLEQLVKQRFVIEGDLRQALKHNEFQMYLQSQVDDMGIVKGAEALIRWQHPVKGLISPAQFIPIAEESNLIVDIDNWVLEQICRLIGEEKIAHLPIRFSVNISARHFNQRRFVSQVKEVLHKTGAAPSQLTLEITEGVVIGNIDDVIAKMLALSELGIHFSMDDFGTGYSSLSYLKRLPIQELKIDRSFIQGITSDDNGAALVEVILSVAKHLKLKIVAEGVETIEQAEFLNRRAKVLHQGYLFSRPEPVASWVAKQLETAQQ